MEEYGKGFFYSVLIRMSLFNERFPDFKIVAALLHKLSRLHFVEILPMDNELRRDIPTYTVLKNGAFECLIGKLIRYRLLCLVNSNAFSTQFPHIFYFRKLYMLFGIEIKCLSIA